jgi:glycosyltransferase involved in cell wall biosynthesis
VRLLLVNWQDRRNPQAGGAEVHLHEIFGRLAGAGAQVTLLASGWRGAPGRERVDGMDVHRTGSRHTFGVAAPLYHRRVLAGRGFDVVVEALNKVPVFSPLWAAAPVVLLVHHLFGATAFREASAPVAALTWLLERPLGRAYRGVPVEAISRSTADDLVARGIAPEAIRVVHPGIDLSFFTPAEPPRREPVPTFLYLGRLKRYKGIDRLLRAAAMLRAEGVRVRLVIGGRGDWEPRLRALAGELGVAGETEFCGFVSEDRKRELFRMAWANVFPSPKEGWGMTNIEAAACGTPSIASDSPGLRESVVHGRTGLLVPHGDVEALAGAMRRVAADPGLRDALAEGAREFALGFGWDRAADETARHLREVAAGGRVVRGHEVGRPA